MPVKGITSLSNLITKIKGLKIAVYAKILEIIEREKPALVEINRKYFELEGVRPDGQSLGIYSDAYKEYKAQYGKYKQIDHVDLKFSGDFLNSIQLTYKGNLIWEFEAKDWKYPMLEERYGGLFNTGGKLLGLSDADFADFVDNIIAPELMEFLDSYFNIKTAIAA